MKMPTTARLASFATLSLLLLAPPAMSVDRQQLDRLVAEAMAAGRLPSLSVAVARDGEVVYAAAAGFAELENAVPATERSVYPIGSVAKPLTAVAALQLAESGRLDLDAPLERSCPGFPAKEEPVTVRQLLGHLGGIRGYDYSRFEEDYLNDELYESIDAALEKFVADPLVAPPGAAYEYSSYGYVLVGCAIEGAAGEPYRKYLRTGVLERAGMALTRLDDPREIIPFRVAGYSLGEDGEWRPVGCFNPSDRYPAGGVVTTPTDLARFGIAVLEGRLLSPGSRDLMWEPQRTAAGEPTGAGLGWRVSEDGAEVFHGGTTVGGTAYLYARPSDRIVVAFATNLSLWTGGRHELAQALADAAAAESSAAMN